MKTWQVFELSPAEWRLESDLFHNNRSVPPALLGKNKAGIILAPLKIVDDQLQKGQDILLAKVAKARLRNVMSGAGNCSVTVGTKTFVVYMVNEHRNGLKGVPHYILSYDHQTGDITEPLLLGESGHRLDLHNTPVIAVDSKGYLHVILGAHWHSMPYLKSKKPANFTEWSDVRYIAGNGDNRWSRNGLSYPGLLIDQKDTLHLVVRGRNSHFVKSDSTDPADPKDYGPHLNYALVYLRKKTGQAWEERKDLVILKNHLNYSNFYHKTALDKKGKLYVSYMYYAHNLSDKDKDIYHEKWPAKTTNLNKSPYVAHDPVLIYSNDGGDSWQITETKDFLQ